MRVRYIFLLLFGLIFIPHKNLLQAAQIDVYATEELANIRLIGKIEKGDAEKFKIIVEYLREEKIIVNVLLLGSIGGDTEEAMQIGTIVRELFIPTQAPYALDSGFTCNGYPSELKEDDCDCSSACFLIWAAGVYRMGDVLGVHQPYFLGGNTEELSATEGQKERVQMYEGIKSYLEKMDIPEHIINKMFNTGSDEITYLDWDSAKSMESVHFFDEWVGANCSRLTTEEERDYSRLLSKKWEGKSTLTNSENSYLNYLEERKEKFNKCLRNQLKESQLKEKTTL
ncbi:MAG: hypothetical protein OET18_10295 [Desulfobacterales bacterium]|nr:hypothetical protein [Desulfobacteraceae bacterium]MDH3839167.1 hypothetical protein [Desulfobacteraceae bacterium]MDH3878223.1 hypothetical protein [Desulfobacterales bacterium]